MRKLITPFILHSAYLIVFLACLGSFGSMVNDLYLPTLPQMRNDFHTSASVVQLGLSFGMLGLGLGELYWGPLSDKIGRKPVFYMSIGLLMLSAVVCVFSPDMAFFLVCRFFQGVGGSGAIMLARSIPADKYTGHQLAAIMAFTGSINGVAPVGGPLFGGFMADAIGWRGIFLVLALAGLGIILLGLRVPESLPKDRRHKGSFLSSLSEYKPLLRNRRFMGYVLLKGAALGALFAYISAGPFIYEDRYGFSASAFGLIFGGNSAAIMIGSFISIKFPAMKRASFLGSAGMAIFAIASGIVISFIDNFWVFEALIVPLLFCSGMVFASSNTLAMEEGHNAAGSASAIVGLSGYAFGCVVSPLVGLGDILLSTSLVMSICGLIAFYFGWKAHKLPAMKVQP